MAKRTRNKKTSRTQTSHHAELDKILGAVAEYAKMFGMPVIPMAQMEKMIRSVQHDMERLFSHDKSKKQFQHPRRTHGSDPDLEMIRLFPWNCLALQEIWHHTCQALKTGNKEANPPYFETSVSLAKVSAGFDNQIILYGDHNTGQ